MPEAGVKASSGLSEFKSQIKRSHLKTPLSRTFNHVRDSEGLLFSLAVACDGPHFDICVLVLRLRSHLCSQPNTADAQRLKFV